MITITIDWLLNSDRKNIVKDRSLLTEYLQVRHGASNQDLMNWVREWDRMVTEMQKLIHESAKPSPVPTVDRCLEMDLGGQLL